MRFSIALLLMLLLMLPLQDAYAQLAAFVQ
jgi:hypothetical protein